MNQKGFTPIFLLIVAGIFVFGGGAIWYFLQGLPAGSISSTPYPTSSTATSSGYHITSISPSSGPIGTKFILKGNFPGPRYAAIFWIQNETTFDKASVDFTPTQGVGTLDFDFENSICLTSVSASGLPCNTIMKITPGKYRLYFENAATHVTSNNVELTITPQEIQSPPGGHCGGFVVNPAVCTAGYHCVLGRIADVGGVCVAN